MTLSHLFDSLDTEAAHALAVPVEELRHFCTILPPHSLYRISIIIQAALSSDPRHMFRAQRTYRLLRCLLEPARFECPCCA